MSAISAIKVTRVRVVAHDRLGHDRSSQACSGNNDVRFYAPEVAASGR